MLEYFYLDVAYRYLQASQACIDRNVQEPAGFLTYHSFESAGGALCEANSVNYPRNHKRKLNQFVVIANRLGHGREVGNLPIRLISLRNQFLYPEVLSDGSIKAPKDVITLTQSQTLRKRVKGIFDWIVMSI